MEAVFWGWSSGDHGDFRISVWSYLGLKCQSRWSRKTAELWSIMCSASRAYVIGGSETKMVGVSAVQAGVWDRAGDEGAVAAAADVLGKDDAAR